MVTALAFEPLLVDPGPLHRVGNFLQFDRGFDQIPQPWDSRSWKRGERSGRVGALLFRQAGRQVLFEHWDLIRLRIIFTLGPLGHLLDTFASVQIVIDTDPAV